MRIAKRYLVRVTLEVLRETVVVMWFLFQAEDGIRYLVRSRGLGDVYKRQVIKCHHDNAATLK